jgi:Cu2+-exporting ATPase
LRHEHFSVVRIDDDQLRIKGGRPGSAALKKLLDWLHARPEVVKVRRRSTGALDVELRGGASSAALLSSLEDQLFTLVEAPRVERRVAIVHALPGRVRLQVAGLDDDGVMRLAAWLGSRPGVLRASPSPAASSIVVVFDEAATSGPVLAAAAAASDRADWPDGIPAPARSPWPNTAASSVVLGAALTGVVPELALVGGVALTAIPPLGRALRALRERRLSVDVLDLAALSISVATGQPATAAFITWLLSIGDLLLHRSADSARAAISKLMSLEAPEALKLAAGRIERVPAAKLARGDRVLVPVGWRVPADGVVLEGAASIDEKALTGESMPRGVRAGDRVLAATVVLEGEITVEVERAGAHTTAAKIVKMLEGVGGKPMTLQKTAERVTDKLTLPTLALAAAAGGLTGEIERVTSILITDFGTGVRISLPASALTAMALAARDGVLVKGAQYLERLARTQVVVFDKTGTLTGGTPSVVEVVPLGAHDARDVLALCAAAEAHAAHPLAAAIRSRAAEAGVVVPEPELGSCSYSVGRGVRARVAGREVHVGNPRFLREHEIPSAAADALCAAHRAAGSSSLLVAIDGHLAGVVAYADRPRPETASVVAALRARRLRTVLLSGDSRHAVEAVAAAVGIDEAQAELLPEDKASYVQSLRRSGAVVTMIGDGINDAPALASADVGVSLHGGTDVALETADVVLLDGGLARLPDAFTAGERALRHVKRGLGIVVVPNAVAIVLGALGLVGPALAAVANNGSTVAAALAAVAPGFRSRRRPPP